MNDLQIQKVKIGEVEQLRDISVSTFTETFASVNSAQNMANYLANNLSKQKLADELNTTGSEFYFAILNQQIIGYLKINTGKAQTELKEANSLEIERIYISKEYHGKKAGQFLYESAVQIAAEKSADYIWLGVWEHNRRAISFYRKNGFVEFDKHSFMLGDDEQTDIMMRKAL
ncbi:GNAT family N-acetyltransferase [Mucilaginibacter ximonensis]|uniref:GNAT family N-acetyltransferase n=1 Tax=Mucilaginibacter ximonensis TaxID=538021 RepID=A0ABW5YC07_9SPHI